MDSLGWFPIRANADTSPSVARSLQQSLESAGFSSITTCECDRQGSVAVKRWVIVVPAF
jgi:hypothetical protein